MKSKNKKNIDTSIPKHNKSTKESSHDYHEYYNVLAHRMMPANNQSMQRMAVKLQLWAQDLDRPQILQDFWDLEGVGTKTAYQWIAKCPELQAAHEYAKNRLTSLRIRGATENKYNWNAVKFVLPLMWDDAQKLLDEEIARKVKAEEPSKPNIFNIQMPAIPDSPLVPSKKKRKE